MDTTLRSSDTSRLARRVLGLFKLRIGFVIMITSVAGFAVTPGAGPGGIPLAVLALAVLISSASAGAFNQYVEYDIDRLMQRTRGRAFATVATSRSGQRGP